MTSRLTDRSTKCRTTRLHKLHPGEARCIKHINSCEDEGCTKDCKKCKAIRVLRQKFHTKLAETVTNAKLKLVDHVEDNFEDWLLSFNMEQVKTWMKKLRAIKRDRVEERLRLWKKAPFVGQPQGGGDG